MVGMVGPKLCQRFRWQSQFPFLRVGLGDRSQVVRLGGRSLQLCVCVRAHVRARVRIHTQGVVVVLSRVAQASLELPILLCSSGDEPRDFALFYFLR